MQINQIKPGQMPLAREWNALAKRYNGGSLGRSGTGQRANTRIIGKNISGTDRSRYECMQVSGVSTDLNAAGEVDLVFELDDGDSDGPTAILVDPIEDDQFGEIILDGLAIAKVDSGTATHEYAVASSDGDLTPQEEASDIRLLGSPNASATTYLPVLLGVGSGGDTHFLYTLTAAFSSGTGTATIKNLADDTTIATSQTVIDTLGHYDGLAIGRRGVCVKSGSTYYAITPFVTEVRWNDPDLEYSKDGGSNYTNIDTTEDC